jgi:hypothetical protein
MYYTRGPKTLFEPLGDRGYVVNYPTCGSDTLAGIRDFQKAVAASQAGWMTRMDYSQGHCRLHVFPVNDLPLSIFSR